MSKPDNLGSIINTYQNYDPVQFPSPTAPPPDLLPSSHYDERLKRVPKAWEKAFAVNPGESAALRVSGVEFVLAGLCASDRVSRSRKHGRITYEIR